LYGDTEIGGASQDGAVFSLDIDSGVETTLHSFQGGADGNDPTGTLVQVDGVLYGIASYGGISDYGTIFKLDPSSGAYQILYDFKGEPDGKYPVAGLTYKDGALYGTTTVGGASNNGGTVFKFDLATGVETVLYSFTLGADGDGPYAPLLAIGDALYGTTEGGGSGYYGTVFKVDARTGRETVLHSFTGGKDGEYPFTAPLIEMGGLLYGSTMSTVFQIDPKTGLEKTLHGNLEEPNGLDARHGLLYGTSYVGGKSDDGEIFSLMP
jgi:uncharacterized repeat protein (TIGR03803 family)